MSSDAARCSSQGEEQGGAEFGSVHEDFLQHPRPPAAVVAKCASERNGWKMGQMGRGRLQLVDRGAPLGGVLTP